MSESIIGLRMTKTFRSGMTVPYAFFTITSISGNVDRLYLDVTPFFNQEAMENGYSPLEPSTQYNFVPEGENRWDSQAYAYLTSLDEFKDAIEVKR
ncbi:hypothetical protein [Bacillus sp. JCM 19041]|uniref:hypothetical protein n=1 Tax=Bacillus sp. JCM 19041 TaxID=1460637 RepID=UPI0006CF564A